MADTEVTVETESTPETSEPEVKPPTVVVVESGPETTAEIQRDEHSDRHVEHEARHERENAELKQTLGELTSAVYSFGERIEIISNQANVATQAAYEAEDKVEAVKEEIESDEQPSQETEGVAVAEPTPDIESAPKQHILRRFGW